MGMKLNFTNVDPNASNFEQKLPEGTHTVIVDEVTKPKDNKLGNKGFSMWMRKEGYKSVNRYIQFSTDERDLAKIMNTLVAFGVVLEQRDYDAAEILQLLKNCKGKKCVAEVYHKEGVWTKDGVETPKINVEVGSLRPIVDEVVEEVIEDDDTPW